MMTLLPRLLGVSLVAGALAGLLLGILHVSFTSPLVLQAEAFETKEPVQPGTPQPWEPKQGFERSAYTVLMDVFAGIGFALLLNAAMHLHGGADWKCGLLWGLVGFAAISFAPALGLPPELPGVAGANLLARQAWWVATVIATAVGLAFVVFAGRPWMKLLGVVTIALPHVLGAPKTHVLGTSPVEHLARPFIFASLAAALVFWLLLGALSGWLQRRFRLSELRYS